MGFHFPFPRMLPDIGGIFKRIQTSMLKAVTKRGNEIMIYLTKQQRIALKRKFDQEPDGSANYREFRKRVVPEMFSDGCVLIQWCGMWLGIETDGYSHS
jgi:hypothetical protein